MLSKHLLKQIVPLVNTPIVDALAQVVALKPRSYEAYAQVGDVIRSSTAQSSLKASVAYTRAIFTGSGQRRGSHLKLISKHKVADACPQMHAVSGSVHPKVAGCNSCAVLGTGETSKSLLALAGATLH